MKTTKKILSVLMAVVLALTVLCGLALNAHAADEIRTLAVTGASKPIAGMPTQPSGLQVSEGFSISSAAMLMFEGGKWTSADDCFKGDAFYCLFLILLPVDGYTYADTITATINGSAQDELGNTIKVVRAADQFVLYYLFNALPDTEIAIRNYVAERTIDYRTTISFTAEPKNLPENGRIVWVMTTESGETVCKNGDTLIVNEAKEGFVFYARIEQRTDNGFEVVAVSPQEHVTVKHSFCDRVRAFFRYLFCRLPNIAQEVGIFRAAPANSEMIFCFAK